MSLLGDLPYVEGQIDVELKNILSYWRNMLHTYRGEGGYGAKRLRKHGVYFGTEEELIRKIEDAKTARVRLGLLAYDAGPDVGV